LAFSLGWLYGLPLIVHADTQNNPAHQQANFLTLSDIHFNPFHACDSTNNCQLACELVLQDTSEWDELLSANSREDYPEYGEETNYHLLTTMLAQMQTMAQQTNPDFVLVLGDFIAHRFSGRTGLYQRYTQHCEATSSYPAFIAKLMQYLSSKLEATFTGIPVYPALGNNDSASGNYSVDPSGYFFQQLRQDWARLISPTDEQDFAQTFVDGGGYYSVMLENNLKLIVLNSVLFSVKAKTPKPWYLWFSHTQRNIYAAQQMAWLATQLAQADEEDQRVLIAYHIPVGIDIYNSLSFWAKWFRVTLQWQSEMMQQFVDLIQQYQSIIVGQLGSHLHTDGLYLINDDDDSPMAFISTTPSISPVYLNNPGFKVYTYQRSPGEIIDFSSFYLDISQHEPQVQLEYTYSQAYGEQYTPLDAQHVANLFNSIGFEQGISAHGEDYRQFFYVNAINPVIEQYWQNYWCGMVGITNVTGYQSCIRD